MNEEQLNKIIEAQEKIIRMMKDLLIVSHAELKTWRETIMREFLIAVFQTDQEKKNFMSEFDKKLNENINDTKASFIVHYEKKFDKEDDYIKSLLQS